MRPVELPHYEDDKLHAIRMKLFYPSPDDLPGDPLYHRLAKKIEAVLPKRRRVKPAVCPITGEDTTNRSGVSNRALDLVIKGIEYERIATERHVERKLHVFSRFWLDYDAGPNPESRGDLSGSALYSDFVHLIEAITEQRTFDLHVRKAAERGAIWLHDPALNPPQVADACAIMMTEVEAERFRALGEAIRKQNQKIHDQAMWSGSSWVARMASGEVSIDRLNDWAAHTEARRESR